MGKALGAKPLAEARREPRETARGAMDSESWAEQWVQLGASRRVTVDTRDAWPTRQPCAKCGQIKETTYRHHKGYDSYVGQWNKGIAFNYYKWLDCVPLCFNCHCTIHFIYNRYCQNWVNHTARGAVLFRKVLIGVCDDWLAGRIPTPSVPKAFKQEFARSLKKWERKRKQNRGR